MKIKRYPIILFIWIVIALSIMSCTSGIGKQDKPSILEEYTMTNKEFDITEWSCPCKSDIFDIYKITSDSENTSYFLLNCKACGNWRKFNPQSGETLIGSILHGDEKQDFEKHGIKIFSSYQPLEFMSPDSSISPKNTSENYKELILTSDIEINNLPDPAHLEQGIEMECVYCTKIYPDLGKDCPICNGHTPSFRPARMMDEETSSQEILDDLLNLSLLKKELAKSDNKTLAIKEYRNMLIRCIEKISIYQFNLDSALIQSLLNLDQEYQIDSKTGL